MFTENVSRLRRLVEGARHAEKPLVFSIPGSGLSAISAVKGGIPFLVVLNSGIYRISGVNSYASFLPFGNANEQTEELIRSQILPQLPSDPFGCRHACRGSFMPGTGTFQTSEEPWCGWNHQLAPCKYESGIFL